MDLHLFNTAPAEELRPTLLAGCDVPRREQSGVATDAETLRALAEGNRAYEERFGRVFLICATGLGAQDVLAALRTRLTNDPATEALVVADELRRIALLRLERVLGTDGMPA